MSSLLSFTFGGQQVTAPSGFPSGGISDLQKYMNNFLTIFIIAGIFLLVIYIVWAGIQWITSGGDKQKISTARSRLTAAVIGLIIILLATAIVNAVGYFFKVNLLKLS